MRSPPSPETHSLLSRGHALTCVAWRHGPCAYLHLPTEVRAVYQTAVETRVRHYTDEGKTETEARVLALDDLGCEQFYAHVQSSPTPLPQANSEPVPHPFSEVERARIRAANAAKVQRLRTQWRTERKERTA